MTSTSIEWTDATWNPVTGCSKVSPGCKNCYAETIAKRFWKDRKFTDVECRGDRLDIPLHWKKPRRIFVNSMSDLFHEDVPDAFIDRVFGVMGLCEEDRCGHTFQVLTKRAERMRDYMKTRGHKAWNSRRLGTEAYPPRNIWLGVSVEDQQRADERIPLLLQTPAAVRFLSCEPLLGQINFNLAVNASHPWDHPTHGISWVIVGGESGHGARPCDVAWIRSILRQCKDAGVARFVKQLGSKPYMIGSCGERFDWPCGFTVTGSRTWLELLDSKGGDPSEWPEYLRVREYPKIGA